MKLPNVCFLLVVLMTPLPRAEAQTFDPKVCKKGTSWQYGADYFSYCMGYEGQGCATARDRDVCERGQRDRSMETTSQVRQAVGDLSARALRLPPLPPDHNPLLGSWKRTAPANAGALGGGSLGELMTMAAAGPCGALLGAGVIEFAANEFFSTDASGRDSLGRLQYRMEGNQVYVIPQGGVQLMRFEILGRDRIRESLVGGDCTLVRVGAAAAVAARCGAQGRAPAPSAQARPQTASVAPVVPLPPGRPPDEICNRTVQDKLGKVDVKHVRQSIEGRFRETTDVKVPNSQNLRIDARGSGCDDPRIAATLYDFDANGVLQSITFVWHRPAGAAPAPIFNERVNTLSLMLGTKLAPQSPGRLQAESPVWRVIVQDMPERNLVREAYAAK